MPIVVAIAVAALRQMVGMSVAAFRSEKRWVADMNAAHDLDGERDVSLMAFDQYLREVRWIETLTDDEEAALVQQVERGKAEQGKAWPDRAVLLGAKEARDRLVEAYLPFAVAVAKRFAWLFQSLELSDVVQEANIGLMEAIEQNDMRKGCALRPFAARCMRNAIWKALRARDRMLHVSEHTVDALYHLRQVRRRWVAKYGCEPSVADLAAVMQASEERVYELIGIERSEHVVSIQGLWEDGDIEERVAFVSLFQTVERGETQRQHQIEEAVRQAYEGQLTPRQKEVMQLRYGEDGLSSARLTYQEIGEQLGIHRTAVWESETLGKKKLVRALAPLLGFAEEGLVA